MDGARQFLNVDTRIGVGTGHDLPRLGPASIVLTRVRILAEKPVSPKYDHTIFVNSRHNCNRFFGLIAQSVMNLRRHKCKPSPAPLLRGGKTFLFGKTRVRRAMLVGDADWSDRPGACQRGYAGTKSRLMQETADHTGQNPLTVQFSVDRNRAPGEVWLSSAVGA